MQETRPRVQVGTYECTHAYINHKSIDRTLSIELSRVHDSLRLNVVYDRYIYQ